MVALEQIEVESSSSQRHCEALSALEALTSLKGPTTLNGLACVQRTSDVAVDDDHGGEEEDEEDEEDEEGQEGDEGDESDESEEDEEDGEEEGSSGDEDCDGDEEDADDEEEEKVKDKAAQKMLIMVNPRPRRVNVTATTRAATREIRSKCPHWKTARVVRTGARRVSRESKQQRFQQQAQAGSRIAENGRSRSPMRSRSQKSRSPAGFATSSTASPLRTLRT